MVEPNNEVLTVNVELRGEAKTAFEKIMKKYCFGSNTDAVRIALVHEAERISST